MWRPRNDRRFSASRPSQRHRGAVVVELLIMLPVWLIALLAVIEFGEVLSDLQQVSLASRVGAESGVRTPGLPSSGPVPTNVLDAIDHQLASSGMSQCKVILEHNVGGSYAMLVSGSCSCDPPTTPLPGLGTYVRVTVCVPMTQLVPNLLGTFGFDISSKLVRQTTVLQYEL